MSSPPRAVHLTDAEPPIPFRFRVEPEDFVVEEVLGFEPAGEGTHLWFQLEKRGIDTPEAVRRVARALGRRPGELGYAGRKDAHALTRQTLSIEHEEPERLAALEVEGVRIGAVVRHPRKLKLGQHRANRFRLLLRDFPAGELPRAKRILARLEEEGLPNAFGAQRFGRGGRLDRLGHLLLTASHDDYLRELASPAHQAPGAAQEQLLAAIVEPSRGAHRRLSSLLGPAGRSLSPEARAVARQLARRPLDLASAVRAIPRPARLFQVAALQARIFQGVLARRIPELSHLATGELAWVHDGGAVFRVEDPTPLEGRLEAFEISPSGPVFGSEAPLAEGRVGVIENDALLAEGLELNHFSDRRHGLRIPGARRPLRVRPRGVEAHLEGSALHLAFELPPGSYATVLVGELRKGAGPDGAGEVLSR